MSVTRPKLGDTIISYFDGKKYTVVACPSLYEGWGKNKIWIDKNGRTAYLIDGCEICSSNSNHKNPLDNDVDANLDNRRDDNLRSIFG